MRVRSGTCCSAPARAPGRWGLGAAAREVRSWARCGTSPLPVGIPATGVAGGARGVGVCWSGAAVCGWARCCAEHWRRGGWGTGAAANGGLPRGFACARVCVLFGSATPSPQCPQHRPPWDDALIFWRCGSPPPPPRGGFPPLENGSPPRSGVGGWPPRRPVPLGGGPSLPKLRYGRGWGSGLGFRGGGGGGVHPPLPDTPNQRHPPTETAGIWTPGK